MKCPYLKRWPKINNLIFHFKTLEKEEHSKLKANRRKKIVKTEQKLIDNKKPIEKINKSKSLFFKIKKIEIFSHPLPLKKKKKPKLLKSRMKEESYYKPHKTKKDYKECYEQLIILQQIK